jgi:hypothetical protein
MIAARWPNKGSVEVRERRDKTGPARWHWEVVGEEVESDPFKNRLDAIEDALNHFTNIVRWVKDESIHWHAVVER